MDPKNEKAAKDKSGYDCVWIQWVLGYIYDQDLIYFMKNCKEKLISGKQNAVIVVRENVTRDETFLLDREDNNLIRSDPMFKEIFEKAGL